MTLDMQFVESQFPALRGREFVYLDNAGGSLVLQGVADRVRDYLLTTSVQHGATYEKSQKAMERVAAATQSVMRLINASRPEEVVMGPSTTALLRILGAAIGETMSEGDEIIVSVSEHEANYGPWEQLARKGVKIVPWIIEPDTYRLDPERLHLADDEAHQARMLHPCFEHPRHHQSYPDVRRHCPCAWRQDLCGCGGLCSASAGGRPGARRRLLRIQFLQGLWAASCCSVRPV